MQKNRTEPKQVSFRISEKEYLKLKKMANDKNISIAKLSKNLVIDSKYKKPKIALDGALKISYELKKIGNNLNQVAKVCNQTKNIDIKVLTEIQKLHQKLGYIWQQLS